MTVSIEYNAEIRPKTHKGYVAPKSPPPSQHMTRKRAEVHK